MALGMCRIKDLRFCGRPSTSGDQASNAFLETICLIVHCKFFCHSRDAGTGVRLCWKYEFQPKRLGKDTVPL